MTFKYKTSTAFHKVGALSTPFNLYNAWKRCTPAWSIRLSSSQVKYIVTNSKRWVMSGRQFFCIVYTDWGKSLNKISSSHYNLFRRFERVFRCTRARLAVVIYRSTHQLIFYIKVALAAQWKLKYCVKSREPKIKRAKNVHPSLESLLGDLS